jgi:hypothetical protein
MSDTTGMPDFLGLSPQDQRDAYLVGSEELGRSATILEKDVWVCWALDALFTCPEMPAMAFKGGTSLSKIFDAISRFSEDIDVTMDHNGLAPELDPYEPKSRKKRDQDDETLRRLMCERSMDIMVPHLRNLMTEVGLDQDMLYAEKDGEVLTVRYPHRVDGRDEYYLEGVKIEFGGRNMIEPNETYIVAPYLAATFSNFSSPAGEISVLSPTRTFWEKFTLAHAASNRENFPNAERNSRHWHDLAVLSIHQIGRDAVRNLDLLADVVRVKERFFRSGTSQYELCLRGESNLLPDEAGLALLRRDYEQMIAARMLDNPISFDEVVERVRSLEAEVNAAVATSGAGGS